MPHIDYALVVAFDQRSFSSHWPGWGNFTQITANILIPFDLPH